VVAGHPARADWRLFILQDSRRFRLEAAVLLSKNLKVREVGV
jgi:hypothetical protein